MMPSMFNLRQVLGQASQRGWNTNCYSHSINFSPFYWLSVVSSQQSVTKGYDIPNISLLMADG